MGLLDSDLAPMLGGLLSSGWNRFRGVDPATGEADYWKRGGLAGLLGMPSWDEQPKTDIAMGFAGSTTPAVKGLIGALPAPTKGIRAYHGSPHDFDRFDLSKIGTGEGAQAYGHGLYFAENEGVARGYRDALAKDSYYTPGGQMFDPQSQLKHLNVRVAARNNGPDLDATIARAQELLPKASEQTRPMIEHDLAVLHSFRDAGGIAKNPGRMYEVEINADPERFLDWDKPLSGQPEAVKRLMGFEPRASQEAEQAVFELARQRGVAPTSLPEYRALEAQMDAARAMDQRYPTGGNIYESQKLVPGEYADKAAASKALRDAGIPGIKYLDQGSRAAGEGSRNYVVFDDSLISILRKYGLLGPMAGGATAGAVGDY